MKLKYSQHWKLELFITVLSSFLIPLIYLLFSPFFGQMVFVPILFAILPLLLIKRYHLLIYYPIGVALVYSLFLLILSRSWIPDFSLIFLAFGSILIPTAVGYALGFLYVKFGNPAYKWMLPIYCLTSFLLAYLVVFRYVCASHMPLLSQLSSFLFLPLVFILSQALISYLYPTNRTSPLVHILIYSLINGFTGQGYIGISTVCYLILAYAIMYLIVTKLKNQKFF